MSKIATRVSIALITLISCCLTHQTVAASRQGRDHSGRPTNGMYFNARSQHGCVPTQKDTPLGEKVTALIPGCAKTSLVATSTDATISIDTSTKYQTIDGFGIFGARDTWWGKAEELYSDQWANQVLVDLGITIWRNEYYPPDSDADWNKQRPVVEGLVKTARDKGIDLKIILSVWSPPASMKCTFSEDGKKVINDQPWKDGTKNGGALCTNKYNEFAQWLIDGIKMYKDIGVDVYAISPQNEPQAAVPYNSCVYTADLYRDMLQAIGPKLKAAYPKVKIFGDEYLLPYEYGEYRGSSLNHAIATSPEALKYLDIFATHLYFGNNVPSTASAQVQLWSNSKTDYIDNAGRSLWMTETSQFVDSWQADGNFAAFDLAITMHNALVSGHVSAWVWWQGSELSGVSQYNLMQGTEQRSKRYYVSKNFFRYIRPGAQMVAVQADQGSSILASAYLHEGQGTLTTVLINTSAQGKTIQINGANVPNKLELYETTADEDCVGKGPVSSDSVFLPAKSVVTLVGQIALSNSGASPTTSRIQKALLLGKRY